MADNSNQAFLNTLFQWTVKNTAEEKAASATREPVQPMNEESKKWLQDALENITVNPVERMKLCIAKIKDEQTSEQQKGEFLEELNHWAEELDLAKDFFTIGGLDILLPLLKNPTETMRLKTCSLIASLVQNNDHCQRIVVQSGLQQTLLQILDESNDPDLKTSALTAVSALIRGYTLGQLQLQKYQGAKVLLRALSLPIPRLQKKLCFLINTICASSAQMKKLFYDNGAIDEFVRLFSSAECPDHQQVLETIVTLSSAKTNALASLGERDTALIEEFEAKLNERRQAIHNSEDYQDEMNLINQLRSSLKPTPSDNATTTAAAPSGDKQLVLMP